MKKQVTLIAAIVMLFTGCTNGISSEPVATTEAAQTGTAVTDESAQTSTAADTEPVPLQEAPVFSVEAGVYAEPFTLEISTPFGEILYTTDGSNPTTSSSAVSYNGGISITDRKGDKNVVSAVDPDLFCGSFTEIAAGRKSFDCLINPPDDDAVDKITTIRVAAKTEDGFTAVQTASYFVGTAEEHIQGLKKSVEAAGQSLAVISISMNYDDLFDSTTGIYVKGDIFDKALAEYLEENNIRDVDMARQLAANYNQRGSAWERPAHIDFLELDADSSKLVISQDCGIRVQGNYSRSDLQKSFRLKADKDYGNNNFKYAVFGKDLTDTKGKTIDKFKTLVLRAGGNCAFTAKFNDTFWQSLVKDMDCDTKASRPCVVYLNGEYWGLYVLEEDYSDDFFEDHYEVNKSDVVVYKGDAETYECGYKLDEGTLPNGETDESYYFRELYDFFDSHSDLTGQGAYDEFAKLVDVQSVMDYFAVQVWINNKWDWPGKNWSMWKTSVVDGKSKYADGRWRFSFYDMEFGGVSGESDINTNTIKEDNYKQYGLLDMNTNNPAVLCFAYLMTNESFRKAYLDELNALASGVLEKNKALSALESFESVYGPLYDQFFTRYPETGDTEEALYGSYASADCIRQFLSGREKTIKRITEWTEKHYN